MRTSTNSTRLKPPRGATACAESMYVADACVENKRARNSYARNACAVNMRTRNTRAGQTSVEAAFLIPVLLVLLLLLTQPIILLCNSMVMENAAAEGCRLLATATTQGTYSQEKQESYVKRRLASIPPVDIFHVHASNCSWDITLEGDEHSNEVSVRIVNQVKPLPLLGWGADFLGLTNENNCLVQEVCVTMPTQPVWIAESGGNDPEGWVHGFE